MSAHLRSDLESASNLRFCAIAYYTDWSTVEECTTVAASAGKRPAENTQTPAAFISVATASTSRMIFASTSSGGLPPSGW